MGKRLTLLTAAGDNKHSNADSGKSNKMLGHEPGWDYNKQIQAAIEGYKEYL